MDILSKPVEFLIKKFLYGSVKANLPVNIPSLKNRVIFINDSSLKKFPPDVPVTWMCTRTKPQLSVGGWNNLNILSHL